MTHNLFEEWKKKNIKEKKIEKTQTKTIKKTKKIGG